MRNTASKIFFCGTLDFILKNLVLDFIGLKSMIIELAQYLPKNLCAPISGWLTFFMCNNVTKNRSKDSCHWKRCLFFKKNSFQQHLTCYRNHHKNFHGNCQKTSWTLINCFLRFVTLDAMKKRWHKIFVAVKTAIF